MAQVTESRCNKCRPSQLCPIHGTESAGNPRPGVKRLMWLLAMSATEFECRESFRDAETRVK